MKKTCGWLIIFIMFGSTAYGGGSGGVCEKPNVLIVLDYSGSMNQNNKWGQAVSAVNQLATAFERTMRLGLMLFPRGDECRVEHREAVLSPCMPDNADAIRANLQGAGSPPRGNNTPIGRALNQASQYFAELQDVGRRSIIVLVTDGRETCRGNPVNAARDAFNSDYPVYVIGFGQGVDGNTLNQIAREGGTDQAYLVNDGNGLFGALDEIADRAQVELCDALDNDCDGRIDESLGDQPCQTECGQGVQQCVNGRYSICEGGDIPEENCNGIDDDCDGEIDENVTVPCVTVSGQPGLRECINGMLSDDCAPEDPNREEVCDGVDNDMDGLVDEVPEERCNYDCHEGRRLCIQGAYVCTAEPVSDETCNGFDDDCDGQIDEGELCTDSLVCVGDGLCLSPCVAGECPDMFFCDTDDLCHPDPCMPACNASQRCRNQQCFNLCQISNDCLGDFVCRNRLCVPGDGSGSPGNPGGGPQNTEGDQADQSDEPPVNPNEMAGTGQGIGIGNGNDSTDGMGTSSTPSTGIGIGTNPQPGNGTQDSIASGPMAAGGIMADNGSGDLAGCQCDYTRQKAPVPLACLFGLTLLATRRRLNRREKGLGAQ